MATATETATLTIHVEQDEHTEAECNYCQTQARWLISTGADPEPIWHCDAHAAAIVGTCSSLMQRWAA